jgi:hypothetical protein
MAFLYLLISFFLFSFGSCSLALGLGFGWSVSDTDTREDATIRSHTGMKGLEPHYLEATRRSRWAADVRTWIPTSDKLWMRWPGEPHGRIKIGIPHHGLPEHTPEAYRDPRSAELDSLAVV